MCFLLYFAFAPYVSRETLRHLSKFLFFSIVRHFLAVVSRETTYSIHKFIVVVLLQGLRLMFHVKHGGQNLRTAKKYLLMGKNAGFHHTTSLFHVKHSHFACEVSWWYLF